VLPHGNDLEALPIEEGKQTAAEDEKQVAYEEEKQIVPGVDDKEVDKPDIGTVGTPTKTKDTTDSVELLG
jgi:hypothetical protein